MHKKIIIIAIVIIVLLLVSSSKSQENFTIPEADLVLNEIKRRLYILSPFFGKIPIKIGNKSFTEDKSVITLCIKDVSTGRIYDINVLMYVVLHEVSHVVTKADGVNSHADEFKNNFAKLLKDAAQKGIYNPSTPIPPAYCGSGSH